MKSTRRKHSREFKTEAVRMIAEQGLTISQAARDLGIDRSLLVPAGLTLDVLHDVLQLAMGWTDSHMHDFRVGQKRFGKPDPEVPVDNECTAHLFRVLSKAGAKAMYTYDFGDGWEHAIVVEKVLPPDPGAAYPMCVAGKLNCPPEDCGGIPGYYDLLAAISDPANEEHEEMMDWLGGEYDPEAFSVDEVNQRLAPLQRWWARSAKT